jgi:type I restriction enzyme S subunit
MAYKQVLLGDYFKFEKGLGYKGEFLVEDSEIALIGMDSHEEGGGYKEGSEKYYSGPFKEEHVAQIGDVIFAGTEQGFGLLGSPLIVPENEEISTYLFSGDVLKAFPLKQDEFTTEYLYNIYRVEKYRRKVAYGDTGTTVRRVSNDNFAEQLVPLPDLKTQESINEIIALIDQQIEVNKKLSRNLENLLKSLFFTYVTSRVDFENYSDIDLIDVHRAESKIPFGWKVARLDHYLKVLESGKRPKGGGSTDPSGIPSVGAESITGLGEFNFGKTKFVPRAFFDKMKSGKVQDGDVLVYKDGAGAGNFITLFGGGFPFQEFCINEHVFRLRANQISQTYLYLWLEQKKVRDLMVELAQKSAQPGLNKMNMAQVPIVVPTEEILNLINEFGHPIVEKILELALTNRKLMQALQEIIPGLVSGEFKNPFERAS